MSERVSIANYYDLKHLLSTECYWGIVIAKFLQIVNTETKHTSLGFSPLSGRRSHLANQSRTLVFAWQEFWYCAVLFPVESLVSLRLRFTRIQMRLWEVMAQNHSEHIWNPSVRRADCSCGSVEIGMAFYMWVCDREDRITTKWLIP